MIITPQVYENLQQLTYGELLSAINNIKNKIYNHNQPPQSYPEWDYYKCLIQELDNRQKDL